MLLVGRAVTDPRNKVRVRIVSATNDGPVGAWCAVGLSRADAREKHEAPMLPFFARCSRCFSSHLNSNLIKAFGNVAPVALTSETSLVNVVFPMAATAGSQKFDRAGYGYAVTTFAGKSFVRPVQDVVGLRAVVENPQRPAVRVMAAVAGRAEAMAMFVVALMTIDTGAGSILVSRRKMTLFTGGNGMQTDERKSSQIMVEEYLLSPRVLVVTVLAMLPFLTVVDIVIRVAAVAVGCQFISFFFSRMTVATGHLVVGATQREFRVLVVIELDLLPTGF